jgi:hypothetical protein
MLFPFYLRFYVSWFLPLNFMLFARVLTFLSSLTLLTMSSFVGPRIHVYIVTGKWKMYFNRLT